MSDTKLMSACESLARMAEASYDRADRGNRAPRQLRASYSIECVPAGKYIRLENIHYGSRSIWGFVVKNDGSVKSTKTGAFFGYGDLLKPAGWSGPTRNFSRGNVFSPESLKGVYWAGL